MRILTEDEPSATQTRCKRRLRAIAPFLAKGGVGAEVGVFKGTFAEHLLGTAPSKLYLVDPWYRLGPEWRWAKGERSTLAAFRRILDAFASEIASGLVEPRVSFSGEFFATLPDHHLDWVYIDTSHNYESTMAELDWCLRKVKPGGRIIGDDYVADPEARHHGVWRAVQDFAKAGRIRLLLDGEVRQFCAEPV